MIAPALTACSSGASHAEAAAAIWRHPAVPAGDRAAYLGFIDLLTPVDVGSTLSIQTDSLNRMVKLAGTSLFGYLVTTGGFTPAANSEVYAPRLLATSL